MDSQQNDPTHHPLIKLNFSVLSKLPEFPVSLYHQTPKITRYLKGASNMEYKGGKKKAYMPSER